MKQRHNQTYANRVGQEEARCEPAGPRTDPGAHTICGIAHWLGFTLIETMFAMVILALALLGAFGAFIHVSQQLRAAQINQYKALLAHTKIERLRVANRAFLFTAAAPNPRPNDTADHIDIGQSGWHLDAPPSVPVPNGDLGTGDLFTILPDGEIAQLPTGGITSCAASNLPAGAFCREVLIHTGVPCPGPTAVCPGGTNNSAIAGVLPALNSQAVTIWVRVIRAGETSNQAAVQSQVIVQ